MRCVICGRKARDEIYYSIGDMTVSMCSRHLDEMIIDSASVIVKPHLAGNQTLGHKWRNRLLETGASG